MKVKKATIIRLRNNMVETNKDNSHASTNKSINDSQIDLQRFNCTKCHFSADSKDLVKRLFQIHHQILRVNLDIINLTEHTDFKCSFLSVEKGVEKSTSFHD